MAILLTGAAGFIGSHVTEALLARGEQVIGVDSLNDYYDPRLKQARLDRLQPHAGFAFHRLDISDRAAVGDLIRDNKEIDRIIHLAAQAGVRHSLVDPYAYVQANLMGHLVILEAARGIERLRHLVYASSSSVYGANQALPFAETDRVDTPLSLYAATKRGDELMSHAYGHLFGVRQTGLRFFTVYGPWGRPDMAYYSFAKAIVAGEPITLYDGGTLRRDFTYIDDIVAGVLGVLDHPPDGTAPRSLPGVQQSGVQQSGEQRSGVRELHGEQELTALDDPPAGAPPVRVLNIGNHRSELVSTLIAELEAALGRTAVVRSAPRPPADAAETFASIEAISALTGFSPSTSLHDGIPRFVAWFRAWHGLND
jgi:UDP-glucuronate 4-epimerase